MLTTYSYATYRTRHSLLNTTLRERTHLIPPGNLSFPRKAPFDSIRMRTWFGRGKSLQHAITSACLMAFVLFGYDQGVFGGILQNTDWLNQFHHPSDSKTGIIVSCYNLGCLTGCVLNFFFGERLGRRRAM